MSSGDAQVGTPDGPCSTDTLVPDWTSSKFLPDDNALLFRDFTLMYVFHTFKVRFGDF